MPIRRKFINNRAYEIIEKKLYKAKKLQQEAEAQKPTANVQSIKRSI